MILPMVSSLLALMLATAAMVLVLFATGLAIDWISSTTVPTALCMPRTNALASTPAVICLRPALKSASARTVAVVVPSPASSEVFDAACLTSCAPMFSTLSRSSISSATVTPSLVTVGPPHDLSSTAFRPRGPRVDFTAAASFSTPAKSDLRASVSKANSLTAMSVSPVDYSRTAAADPVPLPTKGEPSPCRIGHHKSSKAAPNTPEAPPSRKTLKFNDLRQNFRLFHPPRALTPPALHPGLACQPGRSLFPIRHPRLRGELRLQNLIQRRRRLPQRPPNPPCVRHQVSQPNQD